MMREIIKDWTQALGLIGQKPTRFASGKFPRKRENKREKHSV